MEHLSNYNKLNTLLESDEMNKIFMWWWDTTLISRFGRERHAVSIFEGYIENSFQEQKKKNPKFFEKL